MYREDLYLPVAFTLLIAAISMFIAFQIPELYAALNLGFLHFVATIVLVASSMVFMLLDYLLGWGRPYEAPTFPSREEDVRTNPNSTPHLDPSPNPTHKHKRKRHDSNANIDPPTKEELKQLKEALGLTEGSLQYKARGQGIYNVVYREQRHVWTHIGSWCELKGKLEG